MKKKLTQPIFCYLPTDTWVIYFNNNNNPISCIFFILKWSIVYVNKWKEFVCLFYLDSKLEGEIPKLVGFGFFV